MEDARSAVGRPAVPYGQARCPIPGAASLEVGRGDRDSTFQVVNRRLRADRHRRERLTLPAAPQT